MTRDALLLRVLGEEEKCRAVQTRISLLVATSGMVAKAVFGAQPAALSQAQHPFLLCVGIVPSDSFPPIS